MMCAMLCLCYLQNFQKLCPSPPSCVGTVPYTIEEEGTGVQFFSVDNSVRNSAETAKPQTGLRPCKGLAYAVICKIVGAGMNTKYCGIACCTG